jgi:hypothetical protein
MISRGPVGVRDVAQVTGSNGEFQLLAPAPGIYWILVNAPGFASQEESVNVVGRATFEIEIVLSNPKHSRP